MEIRIGNSSDYVIIKDIIPEQGARDYEFLRGTIQLKMREISSNIGATFMLGEFKQFQTDLTKLYDTLKYSFHFKNLEDNIDLTFTPTPNGQIEIKGHLRNSDYTGSIDFEIEADQSYLPRTIDNLREMLEAIKI